MNLYHWNRDRSTHIVRQADVEDSTEDRNRKKNKRMIYSGLVQFLRWVNNILIRPSLLIILLIVIVFGVTIVIPNILTVILALKIGLGLTLFIVFMLSSMVMKIAPDHSLSLTVFPVSSAQSCFSPHRELFCFVELYCRRIVNSPELVKIPLLHIKFPIPYNRLVPIPILINPTVFPHWLFVRESMKKRRGTTWSKERNIWPDELYFL